MYGMQQHLLQKVQGDEGLLENLLSFCVNKSGRRGQKWSCSASAATSTQRNQGQKEKFHTSPRGQKYNPARAAENASRKQNGRGSPWFHTCMACLWKPPVRKLRVSPLAVLESKGWEPRGISEDECQIGWLEGLEKTSYWAKTSCYSGEKHVMMMPVWHARKVTAQNDRSTLFSTYVMSSLFFPNDLPHHYSLSPSSSLWFPLTSLSLSFQVAPFLHCFLAHCPLLTHTHTHTEFDFSCVQRWALKDIVSLSLAGPGWACWGRVFLFLLLCPQRKRLMSYWLLIYLGLCKFWQGTHWCFMLELASGLVVTAERQLGEFVWGLKTILCLHI